MPLYDYKCYQCGHADMEYFKMADALPRLHCPMCQQSTYQKQVSMPHTDLKEFQTPIEMFSIAMEDIDEIRTFKRKCPDVDCSDDPDHPDYGLPIARSRKAKLQALSAAGYRESN